MKVVGKILPGRLRVVTNRHGSAAAALAVWNRPRGPLWGEPIRLGEDKFHVYGCARRSWRPCNVEFLPEKIVVQFPAYPVSLL